MGYDSLLEKMIGTPLYRRMISPERNMSLLSHKELQLFDIGFKYTSPPSYGGGFQAKGVQCSSISRSHFSTLEVRVR